ncbi:MAG TPA: DUF6438 domain-containing protein, partial [Polyangiales bacterium]|nr:DUF6438 domain-containing protein [Polyangiales bacterium]
HLGGPEALNTHGFTQIAIERTACYGPCPVYVAVVTAGGKVSYWGDKHVPQNGRRTGTVYDIGFARLARLAHELEIDKLNDSYSVAVTDNQTVYVSLIRNGKKKTIRHYAPAMSGPRRLFAFENEVDRVIERAQWDQQ